MSTDIILDSVGYMLAAKSYKADATTITVVTTEVIPGEEGEEGTPAVPSIPAQLTPSQRRGRQLVSTLASRGAVPGGLGGLLPGVGPQWRPPYPIAGVGLGPPPLAEPRSGIIETTTNRIGIRTENFGFLSSDDTLYRWTTSTVTSREANIGSTITGMAVRGDRDIFLCFGSARDVLRFEDASGTDTASVFGAGEKATLISMLADRPVVVKPGEPSTVYVWTSTFSSDPSYELAGVVLAMLPVDGGILIATDQSWYILQDIDGAPAQVIPTQRPAQHSSDVYLTMHNGRAWASVDGLLYRRSTFAGSWSRVTAPGEVSQIESNGEWIYALVANQYGGSGVWVTDGEAWFLVNTADSIDDLLPGPGRVIGATVDGENDVLAFDDSDPDDNANYATSYAAATTLQGATLARNKQWLQLGAEFYRADAETVGSATAQLQYSVNAGRTWSNAGSSQAVNDEVNRIVADISGSGVTGRALAVRVNVTISAGIAPILVGLWADWEVTEADGGGDGTPAVPAVPDVPAIPETTETTRTPTLFRRWRFTVLAQDGVIDRDGALLGLSGSQIRANIWSTLNQTSAFTDIDGTERAEVTVTQIEEEWPSPSDAALNVSTLLKVTVIEGDQTV